MVNSVRICAIVSVSLYKTAAALYHNSRNVCICPEGGIFMLDCISVENMRRSDAYTIANLVPGLELMHRAAYGVYLAAQWQGRTAIAAGSGNNGGDGFALACILKEHGCECTVFTVSSRLSDDSAFYAARAKAAGVSVEPFAPGCLTGFDTVVDCLLGTGFQGGLRENYRAAIEAINASGLRVISVDINSGMNGDTGEAELAVRSDLTVTIGYFKNGLLTKNAGAHTGRLVCTDIGIVLVREENKICTDAQWKALGAPAGDCVVRDGRCFFRRPAWVDLNIIQSF